MIILSVDPGATTGYVVCDNCNWDYDGMPSVVITGILSKWHGFAALLKEYTPNVIVVEKFILYAGLAKRMNHDTLVTVRVLGVLEYLAEQSSIRFVEQTASVGKSFKLPKAVLSRYSNAHVRDALRHTLAYVRSWS